MGKKILVSVAITLLVVVCGFEILHHDGMVGQTLKPLQAPAFVVKGCFCHGDTPSPGVRVWISGPDSLPAGMRALYSVHVAKDSSIAAGFDVAALLGDLGVEDSAATQLMRIDPNNPVDSLELTHTDARPANGRDTISWPFWYRAPSAAGVVDTLYAAGNSVNMSFDPDGDYWNYAQNFPVRVVPTTSVSEGHAVDRFELAQNYPNPFNPSTTIRYELRVDGVVQLKVFDILGKEIATLVDGARSAGTHVVPFAGGPRGPLASGVYLYRIDVRPSGSPAGPAFTAVRKMVLTK